MLQHEFNISQSVFWIYLVRRDNALLKNMNALFPRYEYFISRYRNPRSTTEKWSQFSASFPMIIPKFKLQEHRVSHHITISTHSRPFSSRNACVERVHYSNGKRRREVEVVSSSNRREEFLGHGVAISRNSVHQLPGVTVREAP